MLLAAEDKDKFVSLLNPGNANPGTKIFVEGVAHEPSSVLEFDDFKKVEMVIGKGQEAIYNGKSLQSEKGKVVSDKPVKEGAKIL
jgi:hypothetical protein